MKNFFKKLFSKDTSIKDMAHDIDQEFYAVNFLKGYSEHFWAFADCQDDEIIAYTNSGTGDVIGQLGTYNTKTGAIETSKDNDDRLVPYIKLFVNYCNQMNQLAGKK